MARALHAKPSALRSTAHGREEELDCYLLDLIDRLTPSRFQAPRPWWEQIDDITLTILMNVSFTEAQRRLNLDPDLARPMRFWQVWEDVPSDGIRLAIQIDQLAGHTVLIEPTGWLLTNEQLACRLSAGGGLVSTYWNTNALMQFTVATNGQIVRRFDPLLYDQPSIGSTLPEEDRLPFGHPGEPRAAAAALLGTLTGVEVPTEWLIDHPHHTWYGLTTATAAT